MSAPVKHLHEFGEFRLDPKERILMRGDQPVELTPKGFELLSLLVENHGRLLGKTELMNKIWADSYVEDSNLTFNIRQLRKILDDDAHSPRYIKTVRQHGYRFIADVKQIPTEDKSRVENQPAEVTESEENKSEIEAPAQTEFPKKTAFAEPPLSPPKTKSFLKPLVFVACDGSNQTQVTNKEGGYPVFVSPDGEWIYYHHGINRTLWRVSLKTGEEQMALNKAKAHFAVSPDGTQVAYSERQGDERILTIASLADGQTIKTFHLADKNLILQHIAWLPDRKNLAYISINRDYSNHILWLQPLDADAPRQIAVLGDKEISGFTLAVSPDGKTLGFTQGEWLHNVVLLKGLR